LNYTRTAHLTGCILPHIPLDVKGFLENNINFYSTKI